MSGLSTVEHLLLDVKQLKADLLTRHRHYGELGIQNILLLSSLRDLIQNIEKDIPRCVGSKHLWMTIDNAKDIVRTFGVER